MGRLVLQQNFRWHDGLSAGEYTFGANGYLTMDGSRGRIQCSRKIEPAIDSAASNIEVVFGVVQRHTYEIGLYDDQDRPIILCRIDEDDRIRLATGDSWIETEQFLTFAYGVPAIDPQVRTDPHSASGTRHRVQAEALPA